MKKYLFVLTVFSLFLTSCGSDPVKFNDTLVEGLIEIDNKVERINDFISDSEYEDAYLVIDSLQQHLKDCFSRFTSLEHKTGEEMKEKALEMLQVMEAEFLPVYKNAIEEYKVADLIEDEDVQEARYNEIFSKILPVYEMYDVLDDEFISLQETFAEVNDMELTY